MNVIGSHGDAQADEHKSMNILCHSSVIEIDSDDNGSIVFGDSQSGEKDTSVSVPENSDECREILKKVVANCGPDINKRPISIIAFRESYVNVNPRLKKDCSCRYEIQFAGEDAIDEDGVSREFYTGTGRALRRPFLKFV